MLDVLLREEIHNVAVVVTRYFGGVLLGTGGLVRAYQGAVQAGLASSTIIDKKEGIQLTVGTDYTGLGKPQYLIAQQNLTLIDTVYTEKVELQLYGSGRTAAGSRKRNRGGDERKRPDFLGREGAVRTRRQKNRNF